VPLSGLPHEPSRAPSRSLSSACGGSVIPPSPYLARNESRLRSSQRFARDSFETRSRNRWDERICPRIRSVVIQTWPDEGPTAPTGRTPDADLLLLRHLA